MKSCYVKELAGSDGSKVLGGDSSSVKVMIETGAHPTSNERGQDPAQEP